MIEPLRYQDIFNSLVAMQDEFNGIINSDIIQNAFLTTDLRDNLRFFTQILPDVVRSLKTNKQIITEYAQIIYGDKKE